MDNVSPTAGSVNWSIGFNLYADNAPISACENKAQRVGWRDAQGGERASITIATVFATGGNAERAEQVLVGAGQ